MPSSGEERLLYKSGLRLSRPQRLYLEHHKLVVAAGRSSLTDAIFNDLPSSTQNYMARVLAIVEFRYLTASLCHTACGRRKTSTLLEPRAHTIISSIE